MKRAIELAKQGEKAHPNPKVGALILNQDTVVAEGYHHTFGGPHAEVEAFNQLNEPALGLTMVVTLEPCSHVGKTPPCVDLIIEKGIQKVVIGMVDPNPLVAGEGIKKLKAAAIDVEILNVGQDLFDLNKIYLTNQQKKRPFTTLKVAMSLDGKIATAQKDSKWISNASSRQKTHELRRQHAAILVSHQTVINDNPSLSVRLEDTFHPFKVIVDQHLKTPITSKLFQEAPEKVILLTHKDHPKSLQEAYLKKGVTIIEVTTKNHHLNLNEAFNTLYQHGIDSIFIEAGHHLAASLFDSQLIDECVVFIAPKLLGGDEALTLMGGPGKALVQDAIKLELLDHQVFAEDIMLHYRIRET
jgi:diaminohydroxyphosphoribosylaminopyrimidine deaminase/5-amino-6-(5-phosphoribosylamino)uracil reductase